jgi:hypothetical protein
MIIRVWSLRRDNTKLLVGLLFLAGACFCFAVVANLSIQRDYPSENKRGADCRYAALLVISPIAFDTDTLDLRVCFLARQSTPAACGAC